MNTDEIMREFGSRVMQRRKKLNIKQSELAEIMNVSDNQISNIENGKSFPKLNNFLLLCNVLDCNADYLISGIARETIDKNIIDMVSTLTIEEQKILWNLLDCYIHKTDVNDKK